MLEVVQPIQAEKTVHIFDMHRLRKRIFSDKYKWNVRVTPSGLEVDDFDQPDTVYLLALNEASRVVGSMRLLPTTGPTMIKELWPHFLTNLEMKADVNAWEVSRFAVDPLTENAQLRKLQSVAIAEELFCGLAELCVTCGIEKLFALYDVRLEQLLTRLNCHPQKLSSPIPIDEMPCKVGRYVTDRVMLQNIRRATGITKDLIDTDRLPPALKPKTINPFLFKDEVYAYAK